MTPHHIRLSEPTTTAWTPTGSERDVIVLMSGGVDSSVTALLLKQEGWNVVGVTMKIPVAEQCDVRRSCCGMEAGYVAKALDIPHYFLDVRAAFRDLVIEPFRLAYLSGRTPSPCVDCNAIFKFGLVWDYLEDALRLKRLATGHYARVRRHDSEVFLSRASDLSRDQSYFLYGIKAERLPFLLLPLGERTKQKVRSIAKASGLPVARRQDSMELCFTGEADYRSALGIDASQPGPILDVQGNEMGRHSGIANFTIGQRKGIGIAAREPLYVLAIDPSANAITVGTMQETMRPVVKADEVNVLLAGKLAPGANLTGKIRSQGEPSRCTVIEVSGTAVAVEFDEPQFAPTPGQRLVLYDGEDVVAGGVICH